MGDWVPVGRCPSPRLSIIFNMSEESDIGLYNLARKSSSSYDTPRKRNPRRLSIVSVLHEEPKTPIKSPSNPALVPPSPKNDKKLSRSNTLPRLNRAESISGSRSDDLQSLSMEASKVKRLRRWILTVVVGTLIFSSQPAQSSNIICVCSGL